MFYNEVQVDCFYFECVYCLSDLFAWKKSTKSSLETGKTFATLLANIETRQLLIEVETEEQFKVWCHNFSTFSKVCSLISVLIMVWKLPRMWKLVRQIKGNKNFSGQNWKALRKCCKQNNLFGQNYSCIFVTIAKHKAP